MLLKPSIPSMIDKSALIHRDAVRPLFSGRGATFEVLSDAVWSSPVEDMTEVHAPRAVSSVETAAAGETGAADVVEAAAAIVAGVVTDRRTAVLADGPDLGALLGSQSPNRVVVERHPVVDGLTRPGGGGTFAGVAVKMRRRG